MNVSSSTFPRRKKPKTHRKQNIYTQLHNLRMPLAYVLPIIYKHLHLENLLRIFRFAGRTRIPRRLWQTYLGRLSRNVVRHIFIQVALRWGR